MVVKDITLDGTQLPIREFRLDWMLKNPSICMIAKRGSGKSWVCRSILKHFRHIPGGAIIAPTDYMNSFYGDFIPNTYIHYEYKSDFIQTVLRRQKLMIKKQSEKAKLGKKVDPSIFLVMDDCLSSKGAWMKDEQIMRLFFDGRHYKIMYVLTMQFPLGIKPELRTNFDYIFLLADHFYSNQKRLYDHYAGMFPTFDAFRQVFRQITADFGSMVIVNRGSTDNPLDQVFWYKADNEEIDSIGCKQYNWFHKVNFNEHWRDNELDFDANTYFADKKKNKGTIRVAKVLD